LLVAVEYAVTKYFVLYIFRKRKRANPKRSQSVVVLCYNNVLMYISAMYPVFLLTCVRVVTMTSMNKSWERVFYSLVL